MRGGNAPAGGFPWVSLVSELLFKRGKSSEFLFLQFAMTRPWR